eukprot:COSAG04_NODE_386_length_15303_cov_3.425151_5_plen_202_part_00
MCRVLIRSCCAAQKAGGEEAKAESGGWVRAPGPWRSSRRRGSDTVRPQGVRGAFGSFCSTLVRSSPPLAPPPSQPWPPPAPNQDRSAACRAPGTTTSSPPIPCAAQPPPEASLAPIADGSPSAHRARARSRNRRRRRTARSRGRGCRSRSRSRPATGDGSGSCRRKGAPTAHYTPSQQLQPSILAQRAQAEAAWAWAGRCH